MKEYLRLDQDQRVLDTNPFPSFLWLVAESDREFRSLYTQAASIIYSLNLESV